MEPVQTCSWFEGQCYDVNDLEPVVLCTSFATKAQCNTQKNSDDEECIWMGGTCVDPPTCETANAVLSGSVLANWCRANACIYATTECVPLGHTTCSEVNDYIFRLKHRRSELCNKIDGCSMVNGVCSSRPETCASVKDLDLSATSLKRIFETELEGCFVIDNSCEELPANCRHVNVAFDLLDKKAHLLDEFVIW